MAATKNYRWKGESHVVPRRDSQKAKLYRAEREAFGKDFRKLVGGGRFSETIAFVRKVESSGTWEKLNAEHHTIAPEFLEVKDGRGCRSARGGRFFLVLPVWARSKAVILHEMAHSASPGGLHNWPFANAFLVLVGRFCGVEVRDKLKASMKKRKVKFAPPRKFSPEHLAKLRAQGHKLAAAARVKRESDE